MTKGLALAAVALLTCACAGQPLARCERRDFTPDETEEAQKALAERVSAASTRGRKKLHYWMGLDPGYPSEPERLNANKRHLNGMKCFEYGYYDEALAEFEKSAEATPESKAALGRLSADD